MRKYEEVRGLMYSIANRIKLSKETASDLVHDAWVLGNIHKCLDHQLSKTITNDMLRARRKRDGDRKKLAMNKASVSIQEALAEDENQFAYIDKSLESLENEEIYEKLLNILSFSEQIAIFAHISKGRTFSSIGKQWNVNKGRVKEAYDSALRKMRNSKLIQDIR